MAAPRELILPSGYKFSPTRAEVILHYLKKKILDQPLPADVITTVEDLYSSSPDQLPLHDFKYGKDNEWYFFSKRSTEGNIVTSNNGYYKVPVYEDGDSDEEDSDGEIKHGDEVVGYVRRLEFHRGQPPNGTKSGWFVMEFRLNPNTVKVSEDDHVTQERANNIVVCKVVKKS